MFPFLCRPREYPKEWRESSAEYYNIVLNEAKKIFRQVMYAERPRPPNRIDSLPAAKALQLECAAAEAFLEALPL